MEVSPGNTITEKLNVYIWDMDETLILLKTLLDGTYAKSFNGLKDIKQGIEIGKMWEKLILQVCDEYFFYEQVSFLRKFMYGSFLNNTFHRHS